MKNWVKIHILKLFFHVFFKKLFKFFKHFFFFFSGVKPTSSIITPEFNQGILSYVSDDSERDKLVFKAFYDFSLAVPLYKIFFYINRAFFVDFSLPNWYGNRVLKPTAKFLELLSGSRSFNHRHSCFPKKARKERMLTYHLAFFQKYLYTKIFFNFGILYLYVYIAIFLLLYSHNFFTEAFCSSIFSFIVCYNYITLKIFFNYHQLLARKFYIGLKLLFYKNYNNMEEKFKPVGVLPGDYESETQVQIQSMYGFLDNFIFKNMSKQGLEVLFPKNFNFRRRYTIESEFLFLSFFIENWVHFTELLKKDGVTQIFFHKEFLQEIRDERLIEKKTLHTEENVLQHNYFRKEIEKTSVTRKNFFFFLKKVFPSLKSRLRASVACSLPIIFSFFSGNLNFKFGFPLRIHDRIFFFFKALHVNRESCYIVFGRKIRLHISITNKYFNKYLADTQETASYLNQFFFERAKIKGLFATSVQYTTLVKIEKNIYSLEDYLNKLQNFIIYLISIKMEKLSNESKDAVVYENKAFFLLLTHFYVHLIENNILNVEELKLYKDYTNNQLRFIYDQKFRGMRVKSKYSYNFVDFFFKKTFKRQNFLDHVSSDKKKLSNLKLIGIEREKISELFSSFLLKEDVIKLLTVDFCENASYGYKPFLGNEDFIFIKEKLLKEFNIKLL